MKSPVTSLAFLSLLALGACSDISDGEMLVEGGTWTTSDSGDVGGTIVTGIATYVFRDGPTSGIATYDLTLANSSNGCVAKLSGAGSWDLTAGNLTVNLTSGFAETTACRNPADNIPKSAANDVGIFGNLNGGVVVEEKRFTVTESNGNTLVFTRP